MSAGETLADNGRTMNAMSEAELVRGARELAERAHTGQVDKAGAAYVEHPARVARRVAGDGGDAAAVAAAWLHDVLEDTPVEDAELAAAFPAPVVAAVRALTRLPGQDLDDYYAAVRADPIAVRVKRADLADNTDPARLARLDDATRERLTAKYARAAAALETGRRQW